jgi:serine/threonine protein kinase
LGEKYGFALDWWGFGIILHEMLVGVPPFSDNNKQALFKRIVNDEPDFTYFKERVAISAEARNLISKLLHKKPKQRIKPEDIPFHPFFKNISFDEVFKKKINSPFVPKIVSSIKLTVLEKHG